MQKWEYLVARVVLRETSFGMSLMAVDGQSVMQGGFMNKKGLDYIAWLKERGMEGWELVASSALGATTSSATIFVTLKRPVPLPS